MLSDRTSLGSQKRLTGIPVELMSLDAAGHEATGTVELDHKRMGRLSRTEALQGRAMAPRALTIGQPC